MRKILVLAAMPVALSIPSSAQASVKVNPHYNGCSVVAKAAHTAAADLNYIGAKYNPTAFRGSEVQWNCQSEALDGLRGVWLGTLTILNKHRNGDSFGVLMLRVCETVPDKLVTMETFRPEPANWNPRVDYWLTHIDTSGENLEHIMIDGLPSWVYLGKC